MVGRGPRAGFPVNEALCACQWCQGGKGLGVRLGGFQKANRAAFLLFLPSSSEPPPGLRPNRQDSGRRVVPGRYCAPGPPNTVSTIKMITADICGGLAMCQALCRESCLYLHGSPTRWVLYYFYLQLTKEKTEAREVMLFTGDGGCGKPEVYPQPLASHGRIRLATSAQGTLVGRGTLRTQSREQGQE